MTKRKRSRARWHQKFYKDWRTNGLGTALGRREETNPRGKNVRNVVKTRFGILTLMHFLKVRFDSMMIDPLLYFPLSPQTFRIAPPMCITKPEVDFAVEVFRSALIQHMERKAK